MISFASKALEECTTVSNMVCMLCKTSEKSAVTILGPPSPFTVGYYPCPVLVGPSPDPTNPLDHQRSKNTVMVTAIGRSDAGDTASM
jgi:hypothetical protein